MPVQWVVTSQAAASLVHVNAGHAQFAESPQNTALPDGFPLALHGQQLPVGELEPERNYHVNMAFQRDIGVRATGDIEYGLLAAFISLSVVAVVDAVGGSLGTTYNSFAGEIDSFGASS